MSNEQFDELLSKVSAIAKVVNAFESDAVRLEAFSLLTRAAFGGATPTGAPVMAERHSEPTGQSKSQMDSQKSSPGKKAKRAAAARGQWTFNRNLDLRPNGKQSFFEFAEEKQPRSFEDRYAAIVYYLGDVLGQEAVTIDDVGSVFRLMPGWREPKQLDAGLRMASSRKGTLETSDLANIRLTIHGRNFIEHDLPAKEKAKA